MTSSFDYPNLSVDQLKALLENANRLGRDDVATEVLKELTRRGAARSRDYASLRWNQQTATDALQPFVQISQTVKENKRTTYTEAGGLKIGRSKDDPEWMWVDTYSAIKTSRVNAVFVCYVPRPGDEAHFELHVDGETVARFGPDDLGDVQERWREIANGAA